VVGSHEAPASVLGTRAHAERFFVPVHGLLPIRLLALPPDAHELPEQATTEALGQRRCLGQLDLSLVEECAPVEAGGFPYELPGIGRGLRASQQAFHRPDVHPAEPGIQAQLPFLLCLLGAPAGGAVPSSAQGLTSMGTGPNSG
jgi:hypothetical protein